MYIYYGSLWARNTNRHMICKPTRRTAGREISWRAYHLALQVNNRFKLTTQHHSLRQPALHGEHLTCDCTHLAGVSDHFNLGRLDMQACGPPRTTEGWHSWHLCALMRMWVCLGRRIILIYIYIYMNRITMHVRQYDLHVVTLMFMDTVDMRVHQVTCRNSYNWVALSQAPAYSMYLVQPVLFSEGIPSLWCTWYTHIHMLSRVCGVRARMYVFPHLCVIIFWPILSIFCRTRALITKLYVAVQLCCVVSR